MAEHRTLITTSLSLQRIEHGEQTVWMAATLAAMLGQIASRRGFRSRLQQQRRRQPAVGVRPAGIAARQQSGVDVHSGGGDQ